MALFHGVLDLHCISLLPGVNRMLMRWKQRVMGRRGELVDCMRVNTGRRAASLQWGKEGGEERKEG